MLDWNKIDVAVIVTACPGCKSVKDVESIFKYAPTTGPEEWKSIMETVEGLIHEGYSCRLFYNSVIVDDTIACDICLEYASENV